MSQPRRVFASAGNGANAQGVPQFFTSGGRRRRNRSRSQRRGAQPVFVVPTVGPNAATNQPRRNRNNRRLNNPANANNGLFVAPLQKYGRTAVLNGSRYFTVTQGLTSKMPPSITRTVLGCWPVRIEGGAQVVDVNPSEYGFTHIEQFDVSVNNLVSDPKNEKTPGDVMVSFFSHDENPPALEESSEDEQKDRPKPVLPRSVLPSSRMPPPRPVPRGDEYPIPHINLPQPLDMKSYYRVKVYAKTGQLQVYVAITGLVDSNRMLS